MEDTLRVKDIYVVNDERVGLNPYSNGRYSESLCPSELSML